MLSDPARPLFGGPDGTPSGREDQDGTELSNPAVTSLVAYIEDCGTNLVTCPRQSTVSFFSSEDSAFHMVRIVCGTWACDYCGPVKRAKLSVRIKLAKPNRFVTLTAAADQTKTPREVYDQTRRQISELAKTYRRDGKEFEFCRVLEVHESGYPHYHLIVRSPWLDQKELSHRWCHFTESYIVDVRKLSNDKKGINYVMKYLGKQEHVPFTNRRVSYTRNFFVKEPPQPKSERVVSDVERWSGSIEDVTQYEFPEHAWEKVNQWHWIGRFNGPGVVRPPSLLLAQSIESLQSQASCPSFLDPMDFGSASHDDAF